MRFMPMTAFGSIALLACNGGSAGGNTQTQPAGNAQSQSVEGAPFTLTKVAQFDQPFAIAFLPDGSALVTEKTGKLKHWHADGHTQDIAGVPATAQVTQGGLLDVALAPDFAKSRTIYLSYSEPRPQGSSLALARATLSGTQLQNFTVIFRAGADGRGGQFGSVIAFAPDGKSLFLSSGERQRFTPAQDPNQALGKILHLTLDGKPAPGNPGAGKTGSSTITVIDPPRNSGAAKTATGRTETISGPNLAPAQTWTSGHRNPYGLVFDAAGHLWETEMGPKGGDEVNLIVKGRNYGWPNASNGDNYDGTPIPDHAAGDGYEAPKVFWNPSISPGGLLYYTGNGFPQWKGSLLIGALSGQALIRVALNGTNASKADQWNLGMRIRDVAQSPDGTLWLLEDGRGGTGGSLMRVSPK